MTQTRSGLSLPQGGPRFLSAWLSILFQGKLRPMKRRKKKKREKEKKKKKRAAYQ